MTPQTTSAPKSGARRARRRQRGTAAGSRGVALILVLTTIAILTSIGVDFSYSTRVNLRLAENARDEARAYYLAKSAVNLSRLLLHFQKKLDGVGSQLGQAMGALSRAPGAAAAPQTPKLRLRLWDIVPIDSNAMGSMLPGFGGAADELAAPLEDTPAPAPGADPPREGALKPKRGFGSFDGSFSAKVTEESSRINVGGLAGLGGESASVFLQLTAMMTDPKYDFIFSEEDANRDIVRREDLIIALKDWTDLDETSSAINPTTPATPFANGFSDENGSYDRYLPRYKAKNGRFDSIDELHMVRGVSDRFMAAFGDRLTVWGERESKLNVNTSNPVQMLTNILIAAQNPNDPALRDPRLLQTVMQDLQVRRMFSFFGLTAQDFISVLQANRIPLNPNASNLVSPNNPFGDDVTTFRIRAVGRVGRVEKTLMAIVRYDDQLGKLLFWKEE